MTGFFVILGMKRFITAVFAIISVCSLAFAAETETFNYVVTYKWGLIQKDAGLVKITKKPHADGYELKMIASTKPWADKVYKVRDTLISITKKEKYKPLQYTYIAHEKNKYRKDDIKFSYAGDKVTGKSVKYKEDKNGKVSGSNHDLEGLGPTYDMLSVYFFLRELDYANMKAGDTVNATIFSGSKEENLTVRCEGKEMVQLRDKTEHEAWHISFKFTQKGGTKSSDDINCWITTDPSHIPLMIVGSLPIGQIRVHYTGS